MSHPLSSGIIVAPILPFTENGAIDWPVLEDYTAQVAAGRPRGIGMNMALSEGSSLSLEEQLEVVRRCKAVVRGQCLLLSGINATYTAQAVEISKRLVEAGADGLVVFPPVPAFLGPLPVAMISDYYGAISSAVDCPLIAFQTNFVNFPVGSIQALSEIPNVVAIKDASFNVDQTLQNIKEGVSTERKIGIMTGSDTFILEALLMGCDGALIGFAASATAQLVAMQEFAAAGKATEAYEIWNKLGPLARIGWSQPMRDYRVRMKYVLLKQGVIPNMVVRAPLPMLSDISRREIDEAFREHGLDDDRFLPAGYRFRQQARAVGA